MRVNCYARGSRWQRPRRRKASPPIPPHPPNSAVTGSHYHKAIKTDVDGVLNCARTAGKIWREQKNNLPGFTCGSFIATSSTSGHIVNIPQFQAAYNAAKAGVRHLCKCLAVEWVRFVRTNSISPGYIATEISNFVPPETKDLWRDRIPMGREGEAHESVGAFLYLASDAASYTTGCDIVVDGGYCLP
jgi:sorbose reductase